MVQKKDLEIVRKFKKKVSKKLTIKKIILFGSRATGKTHKWSDFDLIVVSDEFKGKKSFERGIGFHNDWGMIIRLISYVSHLKNLIDWKKGQL